VTSDQFLTGVVSTDGTGVYTSAVMPTLGNGGMLLTTSAWPNPGLGPPTRARAVIQWFSDPAGANELTSKQFCFVTTTAGCGGIACPHAGDYVRVTIVANFAAVTPFTILAAHRPNPLSFWLPATTNPEAFRNQYMLSGSSGVGAGLTTSAQASYTYEGPAQFFAGWGFNAAAFSDWRCELFSETETGTRTRIGDWQATAGIQSAVNEQVIIPPGVITLDMINGTGATHTCFFALIPDLSRIG
jgi:hypothetical protein